MMGFTSTPSTRPAPKTSAVSRSLPPPGPMTSVVKRDRIALHQVKREPGELVLQVLDLRQIAVEADDRRRGGRVDVHEARLGLLALVERAQRPVAVRAVVHGHARERIPLREQHRVVVVPLGVAHVERRRSRQLQAAGDADGQRGDRRRAGHRPGRREEQRGRAAEHRGEQHDARRAEAVQQRQQQKAPDRRADEIGAVDDVDVLREARDRERDDGAAGEKRAARRACRWRSS